MSGLRPLLAAVLTLLVVVPGQAGEVAAGRLTADELMQRALARDESARQARAGWRHDQELTTERLDASGTLLGTTVRQRQGVAENAPGASGSVETTRNEKTPAASGDFQVTLDLRTLAGRFDLEREPDGLSDAGERCFVVAFRPRAQPPPPANREEKVINQLRGRFWLAQSDLSIVQSEGELSRPVEVAWVASVYRLDFRYRGRRLPRAMVVPASFTLDLGVEAPFYHQRQRQTTVMTNYQPD